MPKDNDIFQPSPLPEEDLGATEALVEEVAVTDEAEIYEIESQTDSEKEQADSSPEEDLGSTQVLSEENVESDVAVGTYVCECPSCATKIYFEKEDVEKDKTLECPSCHGIIDINFDFLDMFETDKEKTSEPSADSEDQEYIIDCPTCDAVVYFKEDDMDENGMLVCPACENGITVDKEILSAYKVVDEEKLLKKKKKLKIIIGSVGGFLLGAAIIIGGLFLLAYYNVMSVGGNWVGKDLYECVYYYGAVSNQSTVSNYSYYGFDPEKKPSEQKFDVEGADLDYETWGDFFEDTTKEMLSTYISINDTALKKGYKLSKDEKSQIDSNIKTITESAESADQTFEEYTKSAYGCAIKEDTMREYLEMVSICQKYYGDEFDAVKLTDKDIEAEYKANSDEYDFVDFYYGYIEIGTDKDEKAAIKTAKTVCAAKNADEFTKLAEKNNVSVSEIVKDNGYNLGTLKSYVSEDTVKFLASAKVNDTFYAEGTTGDYVEVAMVSKARYKDTDKNELGEEGWYANIKQTLTQKKVSDKIEKLRKEYKVKSGLGSLIFKN